VYWPTVTREANTSLSLNTREGYELFPHTWQEAMTTFTEKPTEISKQEWMEKLENVHLQRTDMNRLVMNYLVTGK